MKYGVLTLGALTALVWMPAGLPAQEPPAHAACVLTASAMAAGITGYEISTSGSPLAVELHDLHSDRPYVTGSGGKTDLVRLPSGDGALAFAEYPPGGGVEVWTYYPAQGILILGKMTLRRGRSPFGQLMVGKCTTG